MNSRSATATPARIAMAIPSPVDSGGVRGDGEALTGPAGGDDDVTGRAPRAHAPGPTAVTPTTRPRSTSRSDAEPSLADVGAGAVQRSHQRAFDLRPGGVAARMDHARHRMTALARPGELAIAVDVVEVRAERHELAHPGRPLVGQYSHRVGIAQPTAGGQRVGAVQLG